MEKLKLCSIAELDVVKTFECGQCFRWNADENGIYTGIAAGYPAIVEIENGDVYITSDAPKTLWLVRILRRGKLLLLFLIMALTLIQIMWR